MLQTPDEIQKILDQTREQRLEVLDISFSRMNIRLKTIPEEICEFTWVTNLDISGHRFGQLPNWMSAFTQLTNLNISDNDLGQLPNWMSTFTQLTYLNISNNNLGELPNWMSTFTQLTFLSCGSNNLNSLPDWMGNLTQLANLILNENNLMALPNWMNTLTQLRALIVKKNQLTTLPKWIGELKHLRLLSVSENNIIFPPEEIIRDGTLNDVDLKRLRNFYEQIDAQGVDYLYEAKLLIVGEPRAGKTTLAKKIIDPNYELPLTTEQETTQGINIESWRFPYQNQQFQVNIWDFGGQEIYHATHQFFLTARSLYILLIDARKEDIVFNFWLNIIDLLSENSPLLIVINEKEDVSRQFSRAQLQARYENLIDIIPCNLADNRGLDRILSEIEHHMPRLPHVGSELPKIWVAIRATLEHDSRDFITLSEFKVICNQHNLIRDEDQMGLLYYLHDLGICLYFGGDLALHQTVILKPHWGTQGVYRVLDNEIVKKQWGRFTHDDLRDLWADERYAQMQTQLLQLMIKFQLCYELPQNQGHYIAPQLLPSGVPEYKWDTNDNLRLKYSYEFMPKGIVTRFIVAVHRLIDNDLVWRRGVIISQDSARAKIIEHYHQEEIEIYISGHNKQRLLHTIINYFDEVHSVLPDLKYYQLIPCKCSICSKNDTPEFYKYELLIRAASKGKLVQCRGESLEDCDPSELISDYHRPKSKKDGAIVQHTQDLPKVVVNVNQTQEAHMDNSHNTDNSTHISGGVHNSNLNIHSTLTNVKQHVGSIAHADDETKIEVQAQIDILASELESLKQDHADKDDEINKIMQRVDELVAEASVPNADKDDVEDTGNKLLRAAKKVAEIAPVVVETATNIVKLILTGL